MIKASDNLFGFLSDAVVVCRHQQIIYANPKAMQLLELEEGLTILGQDIGKILSINKNQYNNLQSSKNLRHNITIKGEKLITAEISLTSCTYQEEPAQVVIIKDITQNTNLEYDLRKTKKALSQSQQRYLALTELSSCGILEFCNGKITYANRVFGNFIEIEDHESLVGKDIDLVFQNYPQHLEYFMDKINKAENEDKITSFCKYDFYRKDGKKVYFEMGTNYFYNSNGERNFTIIIKDITYQRQVEEQLRISEDWHKKLIEFLPEPLFIVQEGKITFVNNEGCKLLKLKCPGNIIGKEILHFIHPEEHQRTAEENETFNKNQLMRPLVEHKVIRSDGKVIDVEIKGAPFIYEGRKAQIHICNNITKRKKQQQILKESQERYSKLIELCPDAIYVIYRQEIIFSNSAGAKLLGAKDVSQIIGRNIMDFTPHYEQEKILQRINKFRHSLIYHEIDENKALTLDGRLFDMESSNIDFPYEGKRTILCIARDITHRKIAEENERKLHKAIEYDKMKTEFFANVSHELRTPLNIILAAVQLIELSQSSHDDTFNKYLKMMKQNCYRLLRLINNLIDITRMDCGFLKMEIDNHNIVSVVEEITLSVAQYIESKGVELIFDTDVEEKILGCDADKIERVMLNLLSNAIKFTKPKDKIWVSIQDKKDFISISVKDTGLGIEQEALEYIFDRFKQAQHLFTRSHEGSGIGLSIVKSIVQAHGGTITVNSTLGQGSEFVISLPCESVPEELLPAKLPYMQQDKIESINIEFSDIYF